MVFTSGLFIYHSQLIHKNLTTKEELKHVYKAPIGNPFRRCWWRNFTSALCPRVPMYSFLDIMRSNLKKSKHDRSKIVSNSNNPL